MRTRSNLALLDRAVQGAVALELGDGEQDSEALAALGVVPQRRRLVAGLRVVQNAARDAAFDPKAAAMIDKLLRYRADRDLVTAKLARVGVEPLAVLPRTAWERICDTSKLYRFQPKEDGAIEMSTEVFTEAKNEAANTKLKWPRPRWSLLVVPMAIGAGIWFHSLGMAPDLAFLLASAIALVVGFGGILALSSMRKDERVEIEERILREKIAAAEKDGTICALLWPELKEATGNKVDRATIRIALPDPPADVQERLIAAERTRLPLQVAVVSDAVMFKEPVADTLLQRQREYRAEVERLEALNRDPIAYVVEGSAVAIIDQYGDFPIEKEVMNGVINSEHLV